MKRSATPAEAQGWWRSRAARSVFSIQCSGAVTAGAAGDLARGDVAVASLVQMSPSDMAGAVASPAEETPGDALVGRAAGDRRDAGREPSSVARGYWFAVRDGKNSSPVKKFIINRVPPAGGTAAPLSVPTYASATYGCALAHSQQHAGGPGYILLPA